MRLEHSYSTGGGSVSLVRDLNDKLQLFEIKLQQLKLEKANDSREINFLRDQNNSLMMKYEDLKKQIDVEESDSNFFNPSQEYLEDKPNLKDRPIFSIVHEENDEPV